MWRDKTIYITGAGSGIGLGLVKKALANNANVSALFRSNSQELNKLKCDNLLLSQGDVTIKEDIANSIANTIARFKKIDVIINNAGCMYYMDITKPNYTQMLNMINTNCVGFINLISEALPFLIKENQGHLINITSDAGRKPFPGLQVYSGTKAFVEFCAGAIRQELIPHNIKVTNIQPGNVETPLHNASMDSVAFTKYASENNGQYMKVEDIVDACEYAINTKKNTAVNEILIEPISESI